MGLIDKLIEGRIDRRIAKRHKLIVKKDDVKNEYLDMKNSLKNELVNMGVVEYHFVSKLSRYDYRISRVEKKLKRDIEKYNKRNVDKYEEDVVIYE